MIRLHLQGRPTRADFPHNPTVHIRLIQLINQLINTKPKITIYLPFNNYNATKKILTVITAIS